MGVAGAYWLYVLVPPVSAVHDERQAFPELGCLLLFVPAMSGGVERWEDPHEGSAVGELSRRFTSDALRGRCW